MLKVENLTKKFGGVTAVADFNFTLGDNELLGLIGPNGAGKTTVFNLLSGVYKPSSGQIFLNGSNITAFPPHRLTSCGLVRTFQNVRLMKGVSLLDNMRPAFHLKKKSGFTDSFLQNANFIKSECEIVAQIEETLFALGIIDYKDDLVEDMPYGVQKRAELARGLLFEPAILLLDEPAAGLNPQETDEIMRLINKIHEKSNISIILVEHNMKFVMGLCHRIIVMDQGFIIAEGEPAYVQKHPDVIKAYLGEHAWKKQVQNRKKESASC